MNSKIIAIYLTFILASVSAGIERLDKYKLAE